jgi:hypothetical protein
MNEEEGGGKVGDIREVAMRSNDSRFKSIKRKKWMRKFDIENHAQAIDEMGDMRQSTGHHLDGDIYPGHQRERRVSETFIIPRIGERQVENT